MVVLDLALDFSFFVLSEERSALGYLCFFALSIERLAFDYLCFFALSIERSAFGYFCFLPLSTKAEARLDSTSMVMGRSLVSDS